MVRRAATEALCNLGGHEALVQVCFSFLFQHGPLPELHF